MLLASMIAGTVAGCGSDRGQKESAAGQTSVTQEAGTEQASSSASTASSAYVIEEDPQYNVPTDELLKKFPIKYQTPADTQMEKNIQNRMLNGFNQWNQGYDAWEKWGGVLYSDASIYNVHGVRLTLPEYQKSMSASLQKVDIQMGDFRNMILNDDWMAIQYEITTNGKAGTTMEFGRFKDFGSRGAKVDEGWGGIKGQDYDGMQMFQTDEEKQAQQEFMQGIIDTQLSDTDDLEKKYPVEYPTKIDTERGEQMKALVLQDFEHWNSGYEDWAAWADQYYTEDGSLDYNNNTLDRAGLKEQMKGIADRESVQRVKLMNLLTSEDWTAVHYWNVITAEDGTKTATDTMAFYHFAEQEDGSLKIDRCYITENL